MKKIETETRYGYTALFDALVDTAGLLCETVGRDAAGNLILHVSGTYNRDNASAAADEYFLLTGGEYRQYLQKARKNKLVNFWRYCKLLKETGRPKPSGGIESFEVVTLRLSGMRRRTEYELSMNGDRAEVVQYQGRR